MTSNPSNCTEASELITHNKIMKSRNEVNRNVAANSNKNKRTSYKAQKM